jgi:hypothetical protein
MALKTKMIISRAMLERLAQERREDFKALCESKKFAAAIYLVGYSVECLLKAHVCKTLDLPELPVTYRAHDLLALLLHSGLKSRLEQETAVFESLNKFYDVWNPEQDDRNLRYADPAKYNDHDAKDVDDWLHHEEKGVITWLSKQL